MLHIFRTLFPKNTSRGLLLTESIKIINRPIINRGRKSDQRASYNLWYKNKVVPTHFVIKVAFCNTSYIL